MHPQSVIRTPVIFRATMLMIFEGMIRKKESFRPLRIVPTTSKPPSSIVAIRRGISSGGF